jgi:hypothetical protein
MENTPIRLGDWMQTYGGRQFWPYDALPEDFYVDDIAHALSQICRYGGHTTQFYSVAEHCYLMSMTFEDPRLALEALLHDAPEAYIGDMIRPLKRNMPEYCDIDDRLLGMLFVMHGLSPNMSQEVKDADNRILLDERDRLLRPPPVPWGIEGLEPLGVRIEPLSPERAKAKWTSRYYELVKDNL